MSNESAAPRGLEDVLAEHVDLTDRTADDGCSCGEEPNPRNYHAHVAAEVRAWLVSEAVVEVAARALYAEERNESMGFDAWPEYDSTENVGRSIFEGHARAALAAAGEVGA